MLDTLLGSASAVVVSVAAFLVMLPVIVFIHELGHFQTGRVFGIKIDAFSIGFGPTLMSWIDRHGTKDWTPKSVIPHAGVEAKRGALQRLHCI